MRVCNVHGCGTIYPTTEGGRCHAHRKAADRWRRQDGNPYSTRGHTKRFRPQVLERDPTCTLCQVALSTIADHYPHSRKELVELGLDPNAPEHGRGLCKTCHDRETAQHQPGGWHAPQGR